MYELRKGIETAAGRLLCVLLVWNGEMPIHAIRKNPKPLKGMLRGLIEIHRSTQYVKILVNFTLQDRTINLKIKL
jgi:hypothetical protein